MTHCPSSTDSASNSLSTMKSNMNHPQQKKRKAIAGEEEEEEDRISALPDSILFEILTLVDTKSAFETSFLSNRWRYLWTSLPSLHFDYYDFLGIYPSDTEGQQRFTSFVNQVLSLRNRSDVFSFFLDCGTFVDPSFVDKCLCYAARHNVQQLHLCVAYISKCIEFPSCFINSQSLKVLTLDCGFCYISEKQSLRLPVLKTLHLEGFGNAHETISNSIGNCPNLETLVLSHIDGQGLLTITAPQLRKLELSDVSGGEIVVSAPLLTSFRFQGDDDLPVFRAANLPCLEDAYVDLYPGKFCTDEGRQRMAHTAINMLGHLREAKSITLSMETLEVLAMEPDYLRSHPSQFHKLEHLKLASPRGCSIVDLPLNVISYLTQGSNMATPLL